MFSIGILIPVKVDIVGRFSEAINKLSINLLIN